jgi:hypothetical protein
MRIHWIRSAERKREALGPQLNRSAIDLANSLLNNDAIGSYSHGQTLQLHGLYVTIWYTFKRGVIQIEDVEANA